MDKTNSPNKISAKNDNKFQLDNVTKNYKRAAKTLKNSINKEAEKVATNINLANTIVKFAETKNIFINFKRP